MLAGRQMQLLDSNEATKQSEPPVLIRVQGAQHTTLSPMVSQNRQRLWLTFFDSLGKVTKLPTKQLIDRQFCYFFLFDRETKPDPKELIENILGDTLAERDHRKKVWAGCEGQRKCRSRPPGHLLLHCQSRLPPFPGYIMLNRY